MVERLRRAAERIRHREAFAPSEWLPLQHCWQGLDPEKGEKELLARLGRLEADEKTPSRTRALAAALDMLLWDLDVVPPEELGSHLRGDLLEARLGHYYRRILEDEGGGPADREERAWQPAVRQRRLQETLVRWEEEILPPAVSMVCADAGVAIPSRLWPDLAEGRLSRVRRELGLSGRRETFLRRLERILPAAREEFLAHLEEVLQLVEPDQWERLRPRPEDLALVLRGKLWQRPPRPALEPDPEPAPGPEPTPPRSDRGHGSVEERFRRAFQDLIRHHLEQEVEQALRHLQEDLQGEAGRMLVEALVRSTRGEDTTTGLRRAVEALRREEESRREAEKRDPLAGLARHLQEILKREAEAQGMPWEDLLTRVKELQESPGPQDPDLKVLLSFLQKSNLAGGEERAQSEGGGG